MPPIEFLQLRSLEHSLYYLFFGHPPPNSPHLSYSKAFAIENFLQFPFAILEHSILSKKTKNQSIDCWRDDKFPRKIGFKTSSIQSLESILNNGLALGYLPDYLIQKNKFEVVTIKDCLYSCEQSIFLSCRNPTELSWLNQIW